MIGDVVSKPGRDAVAAVVPRLRREEGVELVVANAENVAGGAGITASTAQAILEAGVDVITLGDHTWDKKEGEAFIGSHRLVVRPANYPEGTPGRGWTLWESATGIRVAVINLCGRVFMPYHYDDPFRAAELEEEIHLRLQRPGKPEKGRTLADGGVHDHEVGIAEVLLPMAAQMKFHGKSAEFGHRFPKLILRLDVRDRNARAGTDQEPRRSESPAEEPQSHHRDFRSRKSGKLPDPRNHGFSLVWRRNSSARRRISSA